MPLGCIHVDDADFPPVPMPCLRCGRERPMQFAGACDECRAELHARFPYRPGAVAAGTVYEPKMNVTPNAVALKDD
jgi:hypothetical protein